MENEYGQEQKILGKRYVKIEDKFLEVRLISTESYKKKGRFLNPQPRARFISERRYIKGAFEETIYRNNLRLDNVKCPICGSVHKNFGKVVEHTSWSGNVKLLIECWSGNTEKELPKHLYLIELEELPIVKIKRYNKTKRREK
ncbi:hypothetical protein LCGC14_0439170 [marine sediment metagenome]|uniref:Uncharacterized protein n=1 Tax=marine sediment metagenome TaxID=412755 RepID=A0A0F9SRR9_9ZZZZ